VERTFHLYAADWEDATLPRYFCQMAKIDGEAMRAAVAWALDGVRSGLQSTATRVLYAVTGDPRHGLAAAALQRQGQYPVQPRFGAPAASPFGTGSSPHGAVAGIPPEIAAAGTAASEATDDLGYESGPVAGSPGYSGVDILKIDGGGVRLPGGAAVNPPGEENLVPGFPGAPATGDDLMAAIERLIADGFGTPGGSEKTLGDSPAPGDLGRPTTGGKGDDELPGGTFPEF
jgi:hypothetical protein